MYRQPDPFHSIRGSLARAGVPFTVTIIATSVVLFLTNYFSHGAVGEILWCGLTGPRIDPMGSTSIVPFWSPVTYPLVPTDYLSAVFGCLWLWWMGGSLERSWSTQRFALFSLSMTLVTAFCVYIGTALLHAQYGLAGVWLPLSAITVAWATVNPRQTILLYFVLPVPAWALAAFEVGLVYFVFFGGAPVLGLFGLLPCLAAFYYVRSGMSIGRARVPRGPDLRIVGRKSSTLDGSRTSGGPLGWYKAWQEQRRLRKLWRDSGFSDKDR